jgi:cell division GTPase FtsZ
MTVDVYASFGDRFIAPAGYGTNMKVALIGVGQAGGKIAQRIAENDREMGFGAVQGGFAINTAKQDLQPLDLDTVLIGQDRVKGHGVGGDNELGATIMEEDSGEVMDALDQRISARAEAVLVVAGLGGGTGSGGAPVLVKALKRVYEVPIYALGVLPGRNEGKLYQVNAARSLKTLTREADATLLIDNDAWHEAGESVGEAFEGINDAIARRLGLLLAAGEVEAGEGVAESVVDSSEIINTLRKGGIAALGYATAAASEDSAENVNAITSVVRRALLTNTSLPDATEAEAALVVVAGRPEAIPRKGVERARKWVEEETGSLEVRGGDFPVDSDKLAAIVLLGGVERSGRVQEFMEQAAEAQSEVSNPEADEQQFQQDELDDLF